MLRSFPMVQEIVRITQVFAEHGVPLIPYKGPVLADELWGSFSLRVCADLDFLIARQDAVRGGELLEELGYERLAKLPKYLHPALLRDASEEQFRHRETGLLLELQWAPAPRVFALAFDTKPLWERTRTLVLLENQSWPHLQKTCSCCFASTDGNTTGRA